MLSRSVYASDVRVRREAETLRDEGHRVSVISLGSDEAASQGLSVLGVGQVSGLKVRQRVRNGPLYSAARWVLLPSHRSAADRQFAQAVWRRFREAGLAPDVVHSHDFPALAVGVRIAEETSANLIYDSHEVWGEMTRAGRPEPFARRSRLAQERELAQTADAVVTVSEGAAEVLAERLGLARVVVVRNTFRRRNDIQPPDQPTGAVYSGRIAAGRDLETIFEAWADIELDLHLIGPSDGTISTPSWATIHPASDLDTVERLLVGAGIALVPLTPGPLNHRVALPNKLFEAVSVGVPVVAADLPELRKVVTRDRLGVLYEPGNPRSMRAAVEQVVDGYTKLVDAVAAAAPSYEWSADAESMVDIYRSIAEKRGDDSTSN